MYYFKWVNYKLYELYLNKTVTRKEGNQNRKRKEWQDKLWREEKDTGSKSRVHSLSKGFHSEIWKNWKGTYLVYMKLWTYFPSMM